MGKSKKKESYSASYSGDSSSSGKKSKKSKSSKKDDKRSKDSKSSKKDDKKDSRKESKKDDKKVAAAPAASHATAVPLPSELKKANSAKGKASTAKGGSSAEPWKPIDPLFLGKLKVISCKGLRAADVGGKSDPYVKVKDGLNKQKTQPIMKTLDPKFDKEFEVSLKDGYIFLEVWDHDRSMSDDYLGHVYLDWVGKGNPGTAVSSPGKSEVNISFGRETTLLLQRQISSSGKPKGPKVTGTITVLLTRADTKTSSTSAKAGSRSAKDASSSDDSSSGSDSDDSDDSDSDNSSNDSSNDDSSNDDSDDSDSDSDDSS